MGGVLHHHIEIFVIGSPGAQHSSLGHPAAAQGLAAEGPVKHHQVGPQFPEGLAQAGQLTGDAGPGQLDVPVAFGPEDDHIPHGGADAGGVQNLPGDVAVIEDEGRGRGHQRPLLDIDAGLFRAGDQVLVLPVPADGGQGDGLAVSVDLPDDLVEDGGLPGVFAHADDRHRGIGRDQLAEGGFHDSAFSFSEARASNTAPMIPLETRNPRGVRDQRSPSCRT